MIKTLQLLACAWSVLFFGGILHAADDGITFRYKPPGDAKQIYRTTKTMEQTHTVGETKTEKTTMTQTSVSQWTLERTDNKGDFHLLVETQQLEVDLTFNSLIGTDPTIRTYKFDSNADEQERGNVLSEALGPIYDRLATARLTVTMSPRGEIKTIGGHQELLGDLLKDNPLAAQVAGGGSENAARLNFAERFIVLSDKPVKPGDSWESEFNVDLKEVGMATGKRIFKYVGPDKVGEVITEKFTMTLVLSINIDIKANGAEIKGMLSAKDTSGTVQFDPELGRVVSMKSSYTFGGDINVSANGVSQVISTSQTQTVERILLDESLEKP